MAGEHLLALADEVAVVGDGTEDEREGEEPADGPGAGGEAALEAGEEPGQQRDRGEDGEVDDSEEVEVGWHGAGGIVERRWDDGPEDWGKCRPGWLRGGARCSPGGLGKNRQCSLRWLHFSYALTSQTVKQLKSTAEN